jgi:hypothetical protein
MGAIFRLAEGFSRELTLTHRDFAMCSNALLPTPRDTPTFHTQPSRQAYDQKQAGPSSTICWNQNARAELEPLSR